jgi:hypothetical protein
MPFAVDVISDVICPWCYIGNAKITLGGAQPPEAFLEAFGRAGAQN